MRALEPRVGVGLRLVLRAFDERGAHALLAAARVAPELDEFGHEHEAERDAVGAHDGGREHEVQVVNLVLLECPSGRARRRARCHHHVNARADVLTVVQRRQRHAPRLPREEQAHHLHTRVQYTFGSLPNRTADLELFDLLVHLLGPVQSTAAHQQTALDRVQDAHPDVLVLALTRLRAHLVPVHSVVSRLRVHVHMNKNVNVRTEQHSSPVVGDLCSVCACEAQSSQEK